MVSFECTGGYQLVGESQRACLPCGRWSGKNPVCRRSTEEYTYEVLSTNYDPARGVASSVFIRNRGSSSSSMYYSKPSIWSWLHNSLTRLRYFCSSFFLFYLFQNISVRDDSTALSTSMSPFINITVVQKVTQNSESYSMMCRLWGSSGGTSQWKELTDAICKCCFALNRKVLFKNLWYWHDFVESDVFRCIRIISIPSMRSLPLYIRWLPRHGQ